MTMTTSSRPFPRPPDFPLAPQDLQRWIRFSAKGGIGRARAIVDRASEDGDKDLMMLEGDDLVVLMDLGSDTYLGHCEGVVGLFRGQDVQFLQPKLKKPVMTRRSSTSKSAVSTAPSPLGALDLRPSDHLRVGSNSRYPTTLENGNGNSPEDIGLVSQDSSRWKEKVGGEDLELRAGSNLRSRRRGEVEGLGIEVRGTETETNARTEKNVPSRDHRKLDPDLLPPMMPPALSGAFRLEPLSHSPSIPSLDETLSPSASSDSHFVPSLLTSPSSERTSAPTTPYSPSSDSVSMESFPQRLPDALLSTSPPENEGTDSTTPTAGQFPQPVLDRRSAASQRPLPELPTTLLPFPSTTSSLLPSSSIALDSSTSLTQQRQPKTSGSTTASKDSQSSSLCPPTSAPNSLPGTPGDDPTLAFIFDSYRYSNTNSVTSLTIGSTSATSRTSTRSTGDQADAEVEEMEEVGGPKNGGASQAAAIGASAVSRSIGAASELRDRMLRGEAASALPPHISPTRTRIRLDSTSSSSSSLDGVEIPRRSQIFPRDLTSGSFANLPSLDDQGSFVGRDPYQEAIEDDLEASRRLFHSVFSSPSRVDLVDGSNAESSDDSGRPSNSPDRYRPAMQRRRKSSSAAVKSSSISRPMVPIPTSTCRSPNDSSPVTQVMRTNAGRLEGTVDVFVDSPVSSQGHFAVSSQQGHLDLDQYPLPLPPSSDLYTPSPSSISFHSSVSTDDIHSSLDHSKGNAESLDGSQPRTPQTVPNKLRKKASFRIRGAQSSPRRSTSESQDSVNPSTLPPRLPAIPTRMGSDPFYAASPPSSPARQITRKNSVGSKFSRKSGEKEREKKVDYGAGISNKDFEEETVQIGTSAFEIVKPYVALVSKEEEESRSDGDPSRGPLPLDSSDYLSTSLRVDVSTPSPLFDRSFPVANSHFSPPTPLSAEGTEKSVEDHRAKELKWVQTLASGMTAAQVRKSKKMRALVQSGIPSSVRGKVWAFLAEAIKENKPGLYAHLCSLGVGQHAAAIEQDVDSLLLDNPQFAQGSAGEEDLVAVLNAFSHFDRQLGYYPGLANLVALLLTQMPAEESFFTLVSLVKNYGFRQFFFVGREELRLETIAFSFLLDMVEPKIARRFREFEIGTFDYLFSWLSTMFTAVFPLSTVLRIVDIFLLDPKTRYRAPLAILHLSHYTDPELFPSRDSILNYLLAPPPTAFPPSILVPAIGFKLSDDKVQKAIKKAAQEMLSPRIQ